MIENKGLIVFQEYLNMALIQEFSYYYCRFEKRAWRYDIAYYSHDRFTHNYYTMMQPKPIVLFDMDGTTYDFQTPLARLIQQNTALPQEFRTRMSDTRNWTKIALRDLFDGTQEEQDEIKAIIEPMYQTREFFASLEPYPGVIETIHSLEDEFDIHFCTKPSVKQCDSEGAKRETVTKHFGERYSKKVHMTHDKTMVYGDLLIDDNPHITGRVKKPNWKHILVDQAHNQESTKVKLSVHNLDTWRQQIREALRA